MFKGGYSLSPIYETAYIAYLCVLLLLNLTKMSWTHFISLIDVS
jgi:hypothetical protein